LIIGRLIFRAGIEQIPCFLGQLRRDHQTGTPTTKQQVGLHTTGIVSPDLGGNTIGLEKGRIELGLVTVQLGTEADEFRHK
jgi:hypothetical protein